MVVSISAVSTIGAACFLLPCAGRTNVIFGSFVIITLSTSFSAATLVFPALCAVCGPLTAYGDLGAIAASVVQGALGRWDTGLSASAQATDACRGCTAGVGAQRWRGAVRATARPGGAELASSPRGARALALRLSAGQCDWRRRSSAALAARVTGGLAPRCALGAAGPHGAHWACVSARRRHDIDMAQTGIC